MCDFSFVITLRFLIPTLSNMWDIYTYTVTHTLSHTQRNVSSIEITMACAEWFPAAELFRREKYHRQACGRQVLATSKCWLSCSVGNRCVSLTWVIPTRWHYVRPSRAIGNELP